jgi:hypothetical protein
MPLENFLSCLRITAYIKRPMTRTEREWTVYRLGTSLMQSPFKQEIPGALARPHKEFRLLDYQINLKL